MMVGITIGLFVVAAASMLMVSQLGENRRLLLETQVQQDLRATADIVTRDLRRAGYNVTALNNVWLPDAPAHRPLEDLTWTRLTLSDPNEVNPAYSYWYTRASETEFQLSLTGQTIFRRIGGVASVAQPLTDYSTLRVTHFSVTPEPVVAVTTLACPKLCADGTQECWPRLQVRDLRIRIRGQAASDERVEREVVSRVRVRSDRLALTPSTGGPLCP